MADTSIHEVKVARALRSAGRWLSNHEIAGLAGVAGRTARLHTRKMVEHGAAEVRPTAPGYRYRWLVEPSKRGEQYATRIDEAAEALGL